MATADSDEVIPRSDDSAVVDTSASGVASTAGRALALGCALTASEALDGLAGELSEIGLPRLPAYWGGWEERVHVIARSDRVLAQFGVLDEVQEQERRDAPLTITPAGSPERAARVDVWTQVAAEPTPENSVAFLRLLMTDREPVAAAAAAAALSSWRRSKEIPPPEPLLRAHALARSYAASDIPRASELARASIGDPDAPLEDQVDESFDGPAREHHAESVSLMVHGTGAYIGDWWYPGGDFHTYVLAQIRPDLYAGGHPFTWSGAYKKKHREVAAKRLARWAADAQPDGLHTVFAHSYGGIIALRATIYGLRLEELVLLSAPAERVPVEWRNVGRAVSLRIHMDLVLLAARRRQQFTENVEENHLPMWFWRHGDSHSPKVWDDLRCAAQLFL